jgi:hypothetical protein
MFKKSQEDYSRVYTPEELAEIKINPSSATPLTSLPEDYSRVYTPEELAEISTKPKSLVPKYEHSQKVKEPTEIPEEDKDPRIEQYQKLMESAPLGIVYSNPTKVYGKLDQQLIASLSLLESKLIEMTGNYAIRGRIVTGNNINFKSTPQQIKDFIEKAKKSDGAKSKSKIIEFKKYLKSMGMYSGDVESEDTDQDFIAALQNIEKQLAKDVGNDAFIGLIWQGNGINPQTSPEDVSAALNIAKKKKKSSKRTAWHKFGQSLDTFDVDEYQENGPAATKFVPTADDMGLETGDPFESQQIGKQFQFLPKSKKRLEILRLLAK